MQAFKMFAWGWLAKKRLGIGRRDLRRSIDRFDQRFGQDNSSAELSPELRERVRGLALHIVRLQSAQCTLTVGPFLALSLLLVSYGQYLSAEMLLGPKFGPSISITSNCSFC